MDLNAGQYRLEILNPWELYNREYKELPANLYFNVHASKSPCQIVKCIDDDSTGMLTSTRCCLISHSGRRSFYSALLDRKNEMIVMHFHCQGL